MNKLFFVAVVTLVVAALGGVDAQRRVVRVPRVPRVDLVKKSEEYKKREVPGLLRGSVKNYALIASSRVPIVARAPVASNSSKDAKPSPKSSPATKAKPTSKTGGDGLLKLSMPEDLSATGDGNFLANLTNKKFDVENPTGAGPTGAGPTGATGSKTGGTGETGATSLTGATGIEKEPILTGPTGVATSVAHERHRRKVEENATKIAKESGEGKPKLSLEEIMRRRIDDRRRRAASANDESKDDGRETDKLTQKDRKLEERIRAVDGKPAPPKAVKNETKKKPLKKMKKEQKQDTEMKKEQKQDTEEGKDDKEQKGISKSATGSQGQTNSNDPTKVIDTMIEKERVKRGEIKAPVNASTSKPSKAIATKSVGGKQGEKVLVQKKDAGRSTGLSGVDLNKAHVYDPTLDGLPKQYAWIKTGRMGSIIFRQFKKLQAASPLRSNIKKA